MSARGVATGGWSGRQGHFPPRHGSSGERGIQANTLSHRAHARACRAGASDINSAAVQPDRPRSRMIISVTLHGLSAGRRRGGAGTPNPRAGCLPHGLTTVEPDAGDLPDPNYNPKSISYRKLHGKLATRSDAFDAIKSLHLVMIGVSAEQPSRGRRLKPRQKTEKSPAKPARGDWPCRR